MASTFTDRNSLERRREIKRERESDVSYEIRNRCKAIKHRATVGDALPPAYAKGSLRYAFAFTKGRAINEDELQQLRDTMRRPEAPADAQV
jgi:hypothetical protein